MFRPNNHELLSTPSYQSNVITKHVAAFRWRCWNWNPIRLHSLFLLLDAPYLNTPS